MIRNQDKDIAIIVPAYNASATVRETLGSIQEQQGGLDRVACVVLADDHSTDGTMAVAQSCWTSGVPLVVSCNAFNMGERTTCNDAVQALSRDIQWFFILHADDLAKPGWLEVMLRGIDKAAPKTAIFTASYDLLYPDGRVEAGENLGEAKNVIVAGAPESMRSTLKRGCWFKISSCAIRTSAFRDLGGFKPDMPQLGDWEFSLRVLGSGQAIEYIPLCLSVYRQSPSSVGSQSFRVHLDIAETLIILDRFGGFLSRREMAALHLRRLYWLARRAVASVIRRDPKRLRAAGASAVRVTISLFKSWFKRKSHPQLAE